MKTIIKAAALYIGVIVLSAIIAPFLKMVMDFKFHRILSRCIMIGTFGYIFFLVKRAKIDIKYYMTRMGFVWGRSGWLFLFQGFALSVVFVYAIVVVQLLLGCREINLNKTVFEYAWLVVAVTAAGIVIGIIEEVFFRGVLFREMRRKSVVGAFIGANLIYAALHFFRRGSVFVDETPRIVDSFRVLGGYFQQLMNMGEIWPAFLGLLLFGFILTTAYMRTGSLLFPMGIHAGAVFVMKTNGSWTFFQDKGQPLLLGSSIMYDGLLGWGFLLVMWAYISVAYKQKEQGAYHVELLR